MRCKTGFALPFWPHFCAFFKVHLQYKGLEK